VSVLYTILVLVLPSLALYLLVALLAAGRRRTRRTRYRPGDGWHYEPVWWSANPTGAPMTAAAQDAADTAGSRGGADGRW
jgi:hypothetical protein